MSTVQQNVTPETLLTMPEGDAFELIDGQLVEKEMGAKAGWVGARIVSRLGNFIEQNQLGHLFQDNTPLRCFANDPDRVRKPDACFVRFGRFVPDEPPEGFITIAPDLVIEVVSPNDSYYDVERKVDEYLDAGVLVVWVVNPDTRNLKVYAQGQGIEQFDDAAELTGGDVLPGFRCAVSEFFPASASNG